MAGIFPDFFGGAGADSGVLPFSHSPVVQNPIDANRNAILGYLAGALQGGNLGQSIARGLQGWLGGARTDAAGQAQGAASQYLVQQHDLDPALRSALLQSPALAVSYLQARARPPVTHAIAEYEYARRQGFNGTLADFLQRKRAGAP